MNYQLTAFLSAILLFWSGVARAEFEVNPVDAHFAAKPVHYFFNVSLEAPGDVHASSFAHWFDLSDFQDFDTAASQMRKLGLDLAALMNAVKAKSFEHFKYSCVFYKEAKAAFKEKLSVELHKQWPGAVKMCTDEMAYSEIWVEQGADENQFAIYMWVKNAKGRTYAKYCGDRKHFTTENGPFMKENKKGVKAPLTSKLMQLVNRTDSANIRLAFTFSSKSLTEFNMPEIKGRAPFVMAIYPGQDAVAEGVRTSVSWEVYGATQAWLDSENRDPEMASGEVFSHKVVNPIGQFMVAPIQSTAYIIHATNPFGAVSDSTSIKVERTYLSFASVTFFQPTESDGKKDYNTILVQLQTLSGEVIGEATVGVNLAFDGKVTNYYGPFQIKFNRKVYKKEFIQGKMIVRSTAPTGCDDKWSFSPILEIQFSDGSKLPIGGYGLQDLPCASSLNFDF